MFISILTKTIGQTRVLRSSTINRHFSSNLSDYGNVEGIKLSEVADNVLNIQINRPEKRNAFTSTIIAGFRSIFDKLNTDKHFRTAIISNTGDFFTAGIDLNYFSSLYPTGVEDTARKAMRLLWLISNMQETMKSVISCQKPIISVVNGGCIGFGVDLISCTDIRFCSESTFFQVKEVELGLAADMGSLQMLPRIVSNQSFLREVVFTGSKFSSKKGLEHGLVSKVLPDSETAFQSALDVAKLIASRSPIAVQGSKVNLDYARDHSVADGLKFNIVWNIAMLQGEDVMKSAMAIVSKSPEPPKFDDL
ncbi:delta(3,5)-Delta(2,4)-dienoyl-CoA isomerase, mitochondrial [Brevipalpus obovatus]|uniref:delta(3,5)-Delta(2,4)-dienoyl-CoA isomerase, mitochondrial n=1 Tax=Brevipalpus obovatus TaxID=246614 RepID=UPI003D9F749A